MTPNQKEALPIRMPSQFIVGTASQGPMPATLGISTMTERQGTYPYIRMRTPKVQQKLLEPSPSSAQCFALQDSPLTIACAKANKRSADVQRTLTKPTSHTAQEKLYQNSVSVINPSPTCTAYIQLPG